MTRTSGIPGGASDLVALSPRERDVLRLVVQGRATKAIAAELGLSWATVRDYLFKLQQGLGLRSRAELAVWGLQNPGAIAGRPSHVGLHPDRCPCGAPLCAALAVPELVAAT